ncbi:lysylphosphatidylglycerol synthase domain-containing protein [Pseudomonas profundi]|uniref:lysylphosphatidylglycerol synthase domain-containing protein n=1 Tax=Pseudomonas profundi TaxID=1981513 RepID=UPI001239A8F5|nr:lysylphosphatidylglycerol synthase domain-containing protein [Pseudomonas profundi]
MKKNHSEASPKNDKRARRITWLKRGVTLFFFIVIPVLLFNMIKNVEWQEVKEALQSYSLPTLLAGAAITLASYLVFSSYDLLGRYYTGHKLKVTQVLPTAFVCYAFNLNLGAWVGGIALRYRLYSRLGLSVATVTRVLSISLLANWVGYMILAGTVFSLRLMELPENWAIGTTTLQLIGFALLAVSLAYLLACRFSSKRIWKWRDHEIELPSLRLALMQATLGAVNWSLMAGLIYMLLPEEAFFPSILGILMVSSIAGVVTHIPAGLGVLEAVFLALLQHQIPAGTLLAALIGYRAIYFLFPLSIALIMYLVIEKRAKTLRKQAGTDKPDPQGAQSDDVTRLRTQDERA